MVQAQTAVVAVAEGLGAHAHGPIVLDEVRRAVSVSGKSVSLSPREFALLESLLRHDERALRLADLQGCGHHLVVERWNDDLHAVVLDDPHSLEEMLLGRRLAGSRPLGGARQPVDERVDLRLAGNVEEEVERALGDRPVHRRAAEKGPAREGHLRRRA